MDEGGDSDDEGLQCIAKGPNPRNAQCGVASPIGLPSKAALCVTVVEAPSNTAAKAKTSSITDNGKPICEESWGTLQHEDTQWIRFLGKLQNTSVSSY